MNNKVVNPHLQIWENPVHILLINARIEGERGENPPKKRTTIKLSLGPTLDLGAFLCS